MSESLNQKIQKLLRLAERAGTPEEAEAASRMAEKLMLRWGVDEAMIRSNLHDDQKPEAIVVKYTAKFPQAFIKPRTSIAAGIVGGMGNMKAWISGDVVAVMGFESDVDRALTLVPSLLIQADHALASWWKGYPLRKMLTAAEAKRAKRQFLFGFANEVRDRLAKMRAEVVDETSDSKSTALVLRDRGALVDEEFNAVMGNRLRPARSVKGSIHGGAAGREAGRRANLGGTSLGSGSRGALGR